MGRRPLPNLVWFLLASAVLTLIVARTLPPVIANGVNYVTVAHVLLLTSFGLFGLTLLEIVILYIPSLVSAQWVLLVLLVAFTLFAGRTERLKFDDWAPGTYPQPKSTGFLSRIFSGGPPPPAPAPRSSLQAPANPPQNTPEDNPSSLPPLRPRPPDNPDAPPPTLQHPETATANLPQLPANSDASNHPLPPPASTAPKLPAITVTQRNTIRDAMKPYAGLRFTLLRINPTDDSHHYADQIKSALTSAGLINSSDQDAAANPGTYPAGLSLTVGARQSDAADRLSSAMRSAGLVNWALPISESPNRETFQLIVAPN